VVVHAYLLAVFDDPAGGKTALLQMGHGMSAYQVNLPLEFVEEDDTAPVVVVHDPKEHT
jgi:hypothetical protein